MNKPFSYLSARRLCATLICLHVCLLDVSFSAFRFQPSTCQAQEAEKSREYTKEHPLVYEDAWDLWPYVFLDDNGMPSGYNVDLLTLIFTELDIPFVINLKPTSQALEDLRQGKSDLMLGMVANFHDDYTRYYGKNYIQLFTHSVLHLKGEPQQISNFEDFATLQDPVIMHEGSFSHHLMQDRGWGENAIPMGDMDKAVQLVSTEGKGQVLWNTMSLKWLKNKYHADNMELSPVDMPSGDYRFMSNDNQLLELLDDTFSRLKASNRLSAIEKKWFYPEMQDDGKMPAWLWYVVGVVGLVALTLILAILIFRIRERIVTREGRLRTNRLGLILNASHVEVWTYNVNKKSFYWYDSDKGERKTFPTHEFAKRYNPDDFTQLSKSINRIASKKDDELRLEMKTKDGPNNEKRFYDVALSVLRNDKYGQPKIIIGVMSDITEKYRRQQQFTDILHRYRAVFDTAMIDMIYYDKDGNIADMNRRSQQTFKMELNSVLKEHVNLKDILAEDQFKFSDLSDTTQFYSTLFIDYTKEKKPESLKREGQIYYEFLLVPVFDEVRQLIGAYGTGREVTEMASTYRKAQQNVMQLKATLKNVAGYVENINFALQAGGVRMVTYSPQSHMLTINHRMHEAQYVLTQQRCIELTDPISMRNVMRAFRTMDSRRNTVIDIEVGSNLKLKDGKKLWLQMHLFPTLNAEGEVINYNGICRDTTDIKHTELMLKLETEKAQEIEHVKNQFLHNMCYEIRTPLDTVVNYAEKFEKEHSPEEEEMYINEIKSNSAYLLNLINDILFLSRLDARMVEINPQYCDFSKTFESHCYTVFASNKKEGVKYLVENQFEQLVVNIDDMNVSRIIQQVLANAVHFTEHGYVRAHYEYFGGKLIIAIEDTGSGIAPETLQTIYERFNSQQNENRGTGLGLPICHELAEQLGGTIDINSEVGKGTTVWITIPCEATIIEHKKED